MVIVYLKLFCFKWDFGRRPQHFEEWRSEVEKIFSFLWTCILDSEIFCQTAWFSIKSTCKITPTFVISSQRKAKSASLLAMHAKIYGLYMIFPDIFCEDVKGMIMGVCVNTYSPHNAPHTHAPIITEGPPTRVSWLDNTGARVSWLDNTWRGSWFT